MRQRLANVDEFTSISRVLKPIRVLLLNGQEQQRYVRGADRERMTRARQAAEALFTPKRQVIEQPAPVSVPPGEPSAWKPRILSE